MRVSRIDRGGVWLGSLVLCALLAALLVGAAPAQADRLLLDETALGIEENGAQVIKGYSNEEQIEGACGLAISPGGLAYVSDYYHDAVVVFTPAPAPNLFGYASHFGVDPNNGVCGLAFGAGGALYANQLHGAALRLKPTLATLDPGPSTGIAVDPATNRIYVNKRTYVTAYESSGAPVLHEGQPIKIGEGSLTDSYGIAVHEGRVYAPDAEEQGVEVYEPAVDVDDPVDGLKGPGKASKGGFSSLVDAALAVDPTNGHVVVLDNAQPGFIHPKAALHEFDAEGNYLGQLLGSPVHGWPSGIAFAQDGSLYLTDGNSEESNAYSYGPYFAGGGGAPPAPQSASTASPLFAQGASPAQGAPGTSAPAGAKPARRSPKRAHASRGKAELVQKGKIRVAVSGSLAPTRLPRKGTAPITVQIGGQITPLDPDEPPQLRKVTFAFNRAGKLDRRGLAQCGLSDIDPSNTQQALAACRDSLVGSGRFSAKVRLPEQSPFPSAGKMLAFNGNLKGKPVIFAHIYGKKPVPTSVVLPLFIKESKGTFGTQLDASLEQLTGDWGYVTGIELTLGRKFSFKGKRRSFLSAGCPAPKGFPGALFALAKTSFHFVGGRKLEATLTRSCKVR